MEMQLAKDLILLYLSVAEKPTILDDESSEITSVVWTLNATNMILTCKTKGQPEPRIVWTKDNVVNWEKTINYLSLKLNLISELIHKFFSAHW